MSHITYIADGIASQFDTAVPVSSATDQATPVLNGFSPVSYFEKRRPERGHSDYAVTHRGCTYYLTSWEQQEKFFNNPDQYIPSVVGEIPLREALHRQFQVDHTRWVIVDDRLFVFARPSVRRTEPQLELVDGAGI
ncbi:MAG: hypothetical protein ACFCD0_26350 [Gemmataceae bacterium]